MLYQHVFPASTAASKLQATDRATEFSSHTAFIGDVSPQRCFISIFAITQIIRTVPHTIHTAVITFEIICEVSKEHEC